MTSNSKKIVILGGGFGGLRAARLIAEQIRNLGLLEKYEVVLVDRSEHQVYTPLLYEVATTSKETADLCRLHEVAAYDIRKIIGKTPIRFIQAEVESLDLIDGDIHLKNGNRLNCDFLVLALGAETNHFGIKGLKENSLSLKTFEDAIIIRDKIWNSISEGADELKIVIGGGGATGVELAGELKEWCGELSGDFKKCRLSVTIVEGQQAILSGMNEKIIAAAQKRLSQLNIDLLIGKKIAEVTKNEVILEDGNRLAFDVMIWAGGLKLPGALEKLPLESESRGRPVARGEMECLPQTSDLKLAMRIYGLGDSICFYDPATKKPVPAVARAALVQADIVAHNVIEEIRYAERSGERGKRRVYVPREYPYIVPVGGKWAAAKAGPFVFSGFFGWLFKGLVELNYLISIMPIWRATKIWLKGLWIFIQNDRLG